MIIKAAKEEIDLDVAHIDSEYKIGYELTKELLKETTDVTAIVGLNDMIAFGIMKRELGNMVHALNTGCRIEI